MKRILIVEDDPKSLFALRAVLEQQGHSVTAFGSPVLARHLDANAFDAAIIDLRLPTISGQDFGKQLAAKNARLKIVYVTAYAADDFSTVIDGFPLLVKPLNLDRLLEVIG